MAGEAQHSLSTEMAVFWDAAPCNLVSTDRLVALMVEAVNLSETSVHIYEPTARSIPVDSHLHTRRHENLKSHPKLSFISDVHVR
jgi:hypothetical protein